MSAQRGDRPPSSPLVIAAAGAAFAIGVVATLELVTLALPGPRGTFRTWGPVVTLLSTPIILAVGIPGALIVEAAGRRADNATRATVAGYLGLAVAVSAVLWLLWRALVDPQAPPTALTREFLVLGTGAMAIWGGARVAERSSPAPLFAFAGAALAAIVVVTMLIWR